MLEKITDIICQINPDVDYAEEKTLIDDGIIDSLELMELISELEGAFDIEIGMEELVPEHFNSVEAIENMIRRLQESNL